MNQISGKSVCSKGVITAESDAELESKWFTHFSKLLSPDTSNAVKPDLVGTHSDFAHCYFNTSPFVLSELQAAVKSLVCGKACGLDGVVAEVLKLEELHPVLLDVLNFILASKISPGEWLESILVPVFKKGSAAETNNYRGIALMSLIAKLFNRMMGDRLREGPDKQLLYTQNGFRPLRSTSQHVLATRRIIEEIRDSEFGKLIVIFIDFSKAFDSVSWDWIRAILLHYGVPLFLVDSIMSLYYGARTKVRYGCGKFTEGIELTVGVLQGDTLAPYLFVIVMDCNPSLGFRIKTAPEEPVST